MHSPHPIHRALVTYSNSATGEIRIKIPALLGSGSEVSISYIGRQAPWAVPTAGDQIVVSADDENLTNIFWLQTDNTLVTTGGIANGTIVDADINAAAAIAQSKINGLSASFTAKLDATATAVNASKVGGRTVFVQNATPTALATGDIWFQVAGL
jgi:hypothetical protein